MKICSQRILICMLAVMFFRGDPQAVAQSPANADRKQFESSTFAAVDGSKLEMESWSVDVPENRTRKKTNQISLAVVRIKSPLTPKGEPVFFLAGGPGGSSIQAVKRMVANGGRKFFELVGGDVVGIDQRGVGESVPNLETDTKYDLPIETPGNRRQMLELISQVCREEAKRWRDRGIDINGYNTVESAHDVAEVCHALGYDKIVLWGGSYGSHLAMAVIRQHPNLIARALLTGPEGPNHTFKTPMQAQQALESIEKLIQSDARLSNEMPDLVGSLSKVLKLLESEPKIVSVDGKQIGISKFDVQFLIALKIGTIKGSGDQVPAMIDDMSHGDFASVAKEIVEERKRSGIWSVMNMVMDCSSGASEARKALIADQAGKCLLGDVANFPTSELANAWGVTDLGSEFRGVLNSEIPVLFIVGDLDSRTPVGNAVELMQGLPNSRLVVVRNAGHNDLPMGMPKLREVWSKFLSRGIMPVDIKAEFSGPPIKFALPKRLSQLVTSDNAIKLENAIKLSNEKLLEFVGDYRFKNGMMFSVELSDDAANCLIGTITGKPSFKLWPKSEAEFVAEIDEIPPLNFVRNEEGEVVSLTGGGRTARRLKFNDGIEFVDLRIEELDKFVGKYDYGELGYLVIRREENRLTAQLPGQKALVVRPVSTTELRWQQLDARLEFQKNSDGKFTAVIHCQHGSFVQAKKSE